MGTYSAFCVRLKSTDKPSDALATLKVAGGRYMQSHSQIGLITGIIKSSYPEGCIVALESAGFDYVFLPES